MTIDIHSILCKNPITRNVLKPKFRYKYAGPYNNLDRQVDYNKKQGKYTKYMKNQKIKQMKWQCIMIFVIASEKIKMIVIQK